MFKWFICFLFVFVTVCMPLSALAESEFSASLSDISCEKNRLFETALSVNTEVSAFVATLEFDQNKVEFKEANALSEFSEISVNSSDAGKVTLAFLNENGTKGEILSFTFKAKDANTFISLKLEQVINHNAEDITLTGVKGANVTITSKVPDKSKSEKEDKAESQPQTTNSNGNKDNLNLTVPAKESPDTWFVVSVSLTAVLVVAIGAVGFILGKNSNSKNKNRKNQYEKNS